MDTPDPQAPRTPDNTPHRPSAAGAPAAGGPDHRDLYLIVAGVVLGIILSQAVLNRFWPEAYRRVFVGPSPSSQQLIDEFLRINEEERQQRQNLAETGASAAATQEFDRGQHRRTSEIWARVQQAKAAEQEHAARLGGWSLALILAVLAVMVIETVLDPRALRPRARLATARYALMALWIALLIAQPKVLFTIPFLLLGALVVVALAMALVPLGRRT
jgi:hypothetical protein